MLIDTLYRALKPVIFALDAERAHRLAILGLRVVPVRAPAAADDPVLATTLWGRAFRNPLGIAAGFDKDAEVPDALLRLGAGHVEIGTVTPRPQPGNPRPRLFRLVEDRAVINRYGFNSRGLENAAARLARRPASLSCGPGLVWANVGKNKDTTDEAADFAEGAGRLAPFADALVVNVSSPNTPGLRDLQGRAAMARIVTECRAARDAAVPDPARRPPLLVKLAPDLDDAALADAAEVAGETGLDGLVMGNTTVGRPPGLGGAARTEAGGLSGAPLTGLATAKLSQLHRLTEGRIPLVAAGGIMSGADAYARIRAGASLVQLYSALVFEGPGLVGRVTRDLAALLRRDGFGSVDEAVGVDGRGGPGPG